MGDGHRITFHVSGYSGLDALLSAILPHRLMARWVARQLVRGMYRGLNFDTTELVVQAPSGAWRVLDGSAWPRVERTRMEAAPGGIG